MVIRRDVGLRLFAMLCRGLFCRGIPLLRQAEHLQKREKQHNFREDHRHANRNDRMGQVTDQRQRDGRYAGAQPVMRGPAQVRNDKPQPRRQPGSAGGQQQLQIFVVGGIERFIRSVMPAPAQSATAVCIMPGPTPSSLRQTGCASQLSTVMRQTVPR